MQRLKNFEIDSNSDTKLGIPIKNTFFPKNLDRLDTDHDASSEVKIVFEDDSTRIIYKKDDKFLTRLILASDYFFVPTTFYDTTVEGKVFLELWVNVLNEYFREFLYSATYAYSYFSWSNQNDGVRFSFSGYRDTFEHFVCSCYKMLREFDASKHKTDFEAVKENMIKRKKNFFYLEPYSQAWSFANSLLFADDFLTQDILTCTESFEFKRFVELSSSFLSTAFHNWVFIGNLTKEDSIKFAQSASEIYKTTSIPKSLRYQKRVICLQNNKDFTLLLKCKNSDESNSSILRYYQGEPEASLKQLVLHKIVFKLLENSAFDYLRTQLQLGYVAYSTMLDYRGVLGGGFYVQSSDYTPEHILTQINTFLNIYK